MNMTPQLIEAIRQINTLISGLVDENKHTGIRQQLLEIISKATGFEYGILVEVGTKRDQMEISAVCLPKWMVAPVEAILGYTLTGYTFPVDFETALQTPPVEVFEHFTDFYQPLPKSVGLALEKFLGVKKIVSMRQQTSDAYLGAVTFATTKTHADLEGVEYLCNNHLVYALRLMQEQAEKARLRRMFREEVENEVKARTEHLASALEQAQAAEEKITESFLGLMKTREAEKTQLKETEGLLEGLRALTEAFDAEEIYTGIMNLPRGLFDYQDAFILVVRESGKIETLASTLPIFCQLHWQTQVFFQQILAGEPIAVHDTKMVAEWRGQPAEILNRAVSALHVPLLTGQTKAILVYTHSEKGNFTVAHQKLAERFSGLALHALKNVELYEKLQHERDTLEGTVHERTEALQVAIQDLQREVKEHEKTEAALQIEKQRYKSLFEQTNDAVFFIGLDGRHLAANPRAASMLDYEMDELLALTFREIVAPGEIPLVVVIK